MGNVSQSDMAELLEVESWQLDKLKKKADAVDLNYSTLNWNQGFEFLVASHATATVTVDLRSQRPDAKEEHLGSCSFPVSKASQHGPELMIIPGTNIHLKISLELCTVAQSSLT